MTARCFFGIHRYKRIHVSEHFHMLAYCLTCGHNYTYNDDSGMRWKGHSVAEEIRQLEKTLANHARRDELRRAMQDDILALQRDGKNVARLVRLTMDLDRTRPGDLCIMHDVTVAIAHLKGLLPGACDHHNSK